MKPGPKPKDPASLRRRLLPVRFTDAEVKRVKKHANGSTVTAYVRTRLGFKA